LILKDRQQCDSAEKQKYVKDTVEKKKRENLERLALEVRSSKQRCEGEPEEESPDEDEGDDDDDDATPRGWRPASSGSYRAFR
jgi:hypothetical protein